MQAVAPPKKYSLACWWLTYRVPVECEAIESHIELAARRSRLDLVTFNDCVARWPKAWARMLAKRAVRLRYLREKGVCPPDGWAPLPGDRRSLNVPRLAQERQFSASVRRGGCSDT